MNELNKLEMLIKTIEVEMKRKKIKKGDMGKDLKMSPVTIASIFNAYEGTLGSLKKILDYVSNK